MRRGHLKSRPQDWIILGFLAGRKTRRVVVTSRSRQPPPNEGGRTPVRRPDLQHAYPACRYVFHRSVHNHHAVRRVLFVKVRPVPGGAELGPCIPSSIPRQKDA